MASSHAGHNGIRDIMEKVPVDEQTDRSMKKREAQQS
jgi:peptidyl-tRNA hydrolase